MIVSKRTKSNAMAELMGEIDAQMGSLRRGFDPGEKVSGTVITVGQDYVVLDLKATMQGFIDRNLFDEEELPEVGDTVDAYFSGMNNGAAKLVLGGSGIASAVDQSIQQAFIAKLPLEGKIDKEVNGGYEVTVCGQRAFCPFSQLGLFRKGEDSSGVIGQSLTFMVQEYDPEERAFVVSHRAVLERERAEKREALMAELKEGDVREGTVTKIMDFGVFVDIGGLEGLIPLREISWDRTVQPTDILQEGQKVTVAILSLNWDTNRFSFSLRATLTDPWHDYSAEFGPGSYVTGTVVKLMPFGAFVQLSPGVEGLVPISRLGAGRRIAHPKEAVSEGDVLDLQIETMDFDTKRIGLKVVDMRVQNLNPGMIAVGAHVNGLIESIRDFGLFVRLSEDQTGLLHVSEADVEKGGSALMKLEAKYTVGNELEVVVKALEGDRISLALPGAAEKQTAEAEEAEDLRSLLRNNNNTARNSGMSSIGSILDDMFKN